MHKSQMMNSLKNKIELHERQEILRALDECGWVKARAAQFLGITERMIGYRMKKYGIRREKGRVQGSGVRERDSN